MKRVLCVVFAIVMSVMTFSSCLAEDAYGLYTTVMDSMEDVKSLEGSYEIKMDVTAGDMSMRYALNGAMQLIEHSETDVDLAMHASMDLGALSGAAGTTEISVYYLDGWMYTNTNGTKVKEEVSVEDLLDGSDADEIDELNADTFVIDREWIVASETSKVDGGKQIYFELDGNKVYEALMRKYEEALGTSLGDLNDLLSGLTGEELEFTLGNFQYTVLVDEDNVMYGASVVCSIGVGEEYEIELQMNVNDLAFDSITEIEVPDDLDSYSESGDWFTDSDSYYLDDYNYYDGYDYSDEYLSDLYGGDEFF